MTDWLRRIFQFFPLSLFATYAFWYGAPTDDRWVAAFKLGAVAALVQMLVVLAQRRPANRLILGANLYLLVAGVLGVGLVTTFASRAGFVGVATAPPLEIRRTSLVMLAATAGAAAVAVAFRGDRTWGAAIPVLVLAVLQRALATRLRGA